MSTDRNTRLSDPAFVRRVEQALPAYLERQRWFTSKGQTIASLRLRLLPDFCAEGRLSLLHLGFADGTAEIRPLPLAVETVDITDAPAILRDEETGSRVVDAIELSGFRDSLYAFMAGGKSVEDVGGALVAEAGPLLGRTPKCAANAFPPQHSSNSVVTYEPDGFLKLFRKTEPGLHPDAELLGYLSGACGFGSVPPFGGALHFRPAEGGAMLSLGLMLGRVENRGELWETMLEDVGAYAKTYHRGDGDALSLNLLKPLRAKDLPTVLREEMGADTLGRIGLLATRTAEMHLHLADADDPEIAPVDLGEDYWSTARDGLAERLRHEAERADAGMVGVLGQVGEWLTGARLPTVADGRIRVHGDYHLGQVLDTGDDLVIIDFEGEPLYSLAYRRSRHPAFKDVAGMLRSLHYAPYAHAIQQTSGSEDDFAAAADWYAAASRIFLTTYLSRVGAASFLPTDPTERATLLSFFLADKALYELAYERASRPDWIEIPRQGIRQVVRMFEHIG